MRILMLYGPGEIAKELSRQGHDVLAVCCDIEGTIQAQVAERLTLKTLQGRQKLSWKAIAGVRKMILEFRPDIVHAYTNFSLAWVNLATIGLRGSGVDPRIYSFRGITSPVSRIDPANWLTFRSNRVAEHVCESKAVRKSMLESHIHVASDAVVYNCVPHPQVLLTRQQAREELGIPSDVFVAGTIATIRPVKGMDVFLQAAIKIPDPKTQFAIIGSGSYRGFKRLAESSQLSNRLYLPGGIHDAKRLLPAFDLFVMPSRSEGLCRALIEAMQCGLAPIVSDAGGMRELVRDKIDGLVVKKENAQALTEAIERLRDDSQLRSQMGQSAKRRAEEMCNPKIVVQRLLHIYQRNGLDQ